MEKVKGLIILRLDNLPRVYPDHLLQQLQEQVEFVAEPQTTENIQSRPELLKDVDVIFSSWGMVPLDEKLLAYAPKLQAVFYAAGSIRYFTSDALWKRGVRVSSAYHVNGEFVANTTLAQIFLSLKCYWSHVRLYKQTHQTWQRVHTPGMYRSTIGIISLGAIGRRVAELLQPFDLNVIAYDPFTSREQAELLWVELTSLDQVFTRSDVVSLHTPWLPQTEGMITGRHLLSMKPNATFINTARGAIVREQEMIAAMEQRPDLTALLDVTYPEPPAENSKLFSLPNVVLSPHIAGAMDGEIEKMGAIMVDEFFRWLHNQPLQYEIDAETAKNLA